MGGRGSANVSGTASSKPGGKKPIGSSHESLSLVQSMYWSFPLFPFSSPKHEIMMVEDSEGFHVFMILFSVSFKKPLRWKFGHQS